MVEFETVQEEPFNSKRTANSYQDFRISKEIRNFFNAICACWQHTVKRIPHSTDSLWDFRNCGTYKE